MYSSTLYLTSALGGVAGQRHTPAALPPRNIRYPLYRRLDGPQGRSGRVRRMSPPHRDSIPGPPASRQSLYQLTYLGPPLGHIVIHLFGPNYLIKGSARYFFWLGGSVKSCRGIKGVVNGKESLGTADLYIFSPYYYSYQKDEGAKHEYLQTKNCYFRYLGHWTRYLKLFLPMLQNVRTRSTNRKTFRPNLGEYSELFV